MSNSNIITCVFLIWVSIFMLVAADVSNFIETGQTVVMPTGGAIFF